MALGAKAQARLWQVLLAAAVVLLSPSGVDAKSGTTCKKQGAIDQILGLRCERRGKSLRWAQFYVVPGKIASVTFSRNTNVLSWSGPVTWGTPTATFYAVEIRSSIAPNWRRAADVAVGSNAANMTGMDASVTYEFRVAAGNPFGLGEFTATEPVNSGATGSIGVGGTQTTVAGSQTTTTTIRQTTSTTTTTVRTAISTTTTTALVGTVSQRNAVSKAASYLRTTSFSRSGLISQLEFEGFSREDATYGVDAQNADWRAQAVKKGASYLRTMAFSRSGLIGQLEFEGFSTSDATFGADAQNADWNAQAAKKAASYLRTSAFSRSGLISQLEFEGFTRSQAEFGVNSVGL